jgi:hypothetical protein
VRLLQEAGLYVIIGMGNAFNYQPSTDQAWDIKDFRRYTEIIDNLAPFPNVIGFNIQGSPITLPYIKAIVRDLRAHMRTKGFRQVLLSTSPYAYWSHDVTEYLACGPRAESPDYVFYSFRNPACGDAKQTRDIMNSINKHIKSYSVPVIFDNGGCSIESQVVPDVVRLHLNQSFIDVGPGSIYARYFDSLERNNVGECLQSQRL